MTQSGHYGFVPGSGVQKHSAGGYYPLTIPTIENNDTGRAKKVVMHGGTGVITYEAKYHIDDRDGCLSAGHRAENFARRSAGLVQLYQDDLNGHPLFTEYVL